MLRRATGDRRIIVIDWETAAVGPPTFDLVSLTAGKWTEEERRAMRAAYFEEYRAATGQRLDREAFCRELAGVSLYQSLEWLAWWGRHRALSRGFRDVQERAGTCSRGTLRDRVTDVLWEEQV